MLQNNNLQTDMNDNIIAMEAAQFKVKAFY